MPVRLAGARCSDDDRSVVAPYHQLGEAFEIVADPYGAGFPYLPRGFLWSPGRRGSPMRCGRCVEGPRPFGYTATQSPRLAAALNSRRLCTVTTGRWHLVQCLPEPSGSSGMSSQFKGQTNRKSQVVIMLEMKSNKNIRDFYGADLFLCESEVSMAKPREPQHRTLTISHPHFCQGRSIAPLSQRPFPCMKGECFF